jgi:hypothetical protein
MNINRKNFLKVAGLATAGMIVKQGKAGNEAPFVKNHIQKFNMHGFAAPKLDKVRTGFIGIGSRGSGTVVRLASIEGVEVKALCDIVPERVEASIKNLKDEFPGHTPTSYSDNAESWKKVCEREDIDLICITTPWNLHAPIAVYAMEHGKHVYTELPVGVTLEECWQVVETSEKTRKHCFMGCGSCHGGTAAVVLNMVRQGFFGEIIHGEGHYIHDRVSKNTQWERDKDNNNWFGFRPWRLQENVNRNGNLYPAHGLAPVSQMMDINYGDKMDYLVSISSNDFSINNKMKEIAAMDDYFKPYTGLDFRGNMNTTIIRTHKGRTIMLQHDISSPRPGHRFELISGNKGIYKALPGRIATSHDGWLPQEEYDSLIEQYTPEITRRFNKKRRQAAKSHGSRGYERVSALDWRLIDCLRNGLPLEMDVYDAALWSSITPLSEWSVARQGASVKIPDFTAGAWKTNARGMDIDIKQGGTTNII